MSTPHVTSLANGYQGWMAAIGKLALVWETVAPMLERARQHNRGEFELIDVWNYLQDNRMQLWCVSKEDKIHAALVTELVYYARFPALRVVLLAGEGHERWSELWPVVEHFARLYGCKHIEAMTRPGVERMFAKATGLREAYRMLSVPVNQGALQ